MRGFHFAIVGVLLACAACNQSDSPAVEAGALVVGCRHMAIDGGESHSICYEERDGQAVLEGDIVLGPTARIASRDAIVISDETYDTVAWQDGVVPYVIDPMLPSPERVTDAIRHIAQRSVVTFKKRTTETDFVTFKHADKMCQSNVGRAGGEQFVTLADTCAKADVIHEIGHVLGLWHEQSRSDRDKYITIHWENVSPGAEIQFNQYLDLTKNKGRYDYGSLMQYAPMAYSKNGQPTITKKDGTTDGVGPGTGLSDGDVAALEYLYDW